MQSKVIGFLLILAGSLLLLVWLGLVGVADFVSWPFLFFLLGAVLLFFGFVKKNGSLVLTGGLIAALFLAIWGKASVQGWPGHWSILLALVGMAVLLHFGVTKNTNSAIVGATLFLSGILAYPGITELPVFAPLTSAMHKVWPVLIIVLGFVFLTRKG
ncbi:hypothetical protein [Staphylospora marina]|uniref:hypothetical protein n=1 Tax=Staphylospora marina TaxID=2490858 RepID=UPI000F5B9372|nr:hypothetical protein [Staphylospora marina]